VISGVADAAPRLNIDKDLPDSESSRLRKELDEKFYLWKQNLLKNTSKPASFFAQMKSLEKTFIQNKYEPYFNFLQTQQKHVNTAFIESKKKKKYGSKKILKKKH